MAVDRYVRSKSGKTLQEHPPPPEVIEISLYDRFGWSPKDVDEIEYCRLQRILIALSQLEKSEKMVARSKK